MNQGVEHSLLDCPGQYTVQVATFRGKTILQTSGEEDQAASRFGASAKEGRPTIRSSRRPRMPTCLTKELRRTDTRRMSFTIATESIVTIGSFAQAASSCRWPRRADAGRAEDHRNVRGRLRYAGRSAHAASATTGTRRCASSSRSSSSTCGSTASKRQIVPGMNPKHVKILRGSGKRKSSSGSFRWTSIRKRSKCRSGRFERLRGVSAAVQMRFARMQRLLALRLNSLRYIRHFDLRDHAIGRTSSVDLTLDIRLVIGTRNRKKGAELAELARAAGLRVVTLDDFPERDRRRRRWRHVCGQRRAQSDTTGAGTWADGCWPTTAGWRSTRWAVRRAFIRLASPAPNATDEAKQSRTAGAAGRHAAGEAHGSLCVPCDGGRSDWRRFAPRATMFATAGFASSRPAPTALATIRCSKWSSTTALLANLGPHVKRAISHRSRALRAILPKLVALARE